MEKTETITIRVHSQHAKMWRVLTGKDATGVHGMSPADLFGAMLDDSKQVAIDIADPVLMFAHGCGDGHLHVWNGRRSEYDKCPNCGALVDGDSPGIASRVGGKRDDKRVEAANAPAEFPEPAAAPAADARTWGNEMRKHGRLCRSIVKSSGAPVFRYRDGYAIEYWRFARAHGPGVRSTINRMDRLGALVRRNAKNMTHSWCDENGRNSSVLYFTARFADEYLR